MDLTLNEIEFIKTINSEFDKKNNNKNKENSNINNIILYDYNITKKLLDLIINSPNNPNFIELNKNIHKKEILLYKYNNILLFFFINNINEYVNINKRPLCNINNNYYTLLNKSVEIIYLDGPIGCGKSTKLNQIKNNNTIVIEEPIELWGLDKKDNIVTNSLDNLKLEQTLKYDYLINIITTILNSNINYNKLIIERSIYDHEFFGACSDNYTELFNKEYLLNIFTWIHNDLLFFLDIKNIIIYQPYNIISLLTINELENMLIKIHNNKTNRGREFELIYNIKYIIQLNRFFDLRYIKKYFEAINHLSNFNIILKDEIYYLN